MKLELLLFLTIAAGAACGADAGSSSAGGVGGGGGGGGQMGTGQAATSGQTAEGAATGTSGGATGAGGGSPVSCADTAECGNFGGGCVKCASKSSCAAEYQACFDDMPCKSYSLCIAPCGAKELDCLQACETQFPNGATEYQALTRCVICGDCMALCEHAPDICK